ncbi:MAG: hypothetical protein EU539_04035 [Promethearchaeota archaeon]|nr:MAG: hypothetical protein EU539_04035 [Candidatus Lokiarchaeota archaeon]
MDISNWFKIITALITVILALFAGYIELRKNPEYWLNRWFAIFFVSVALGFLFYSIYHINTLNPIIIIPMMIIAQILYNFGLVSLLMTVFILEHSEKVAMTAKYLGIIMGLFIVSIFGYFIWVPTLNMERYRQGVVDTDTPLGWFIAVNIIRIGIFIFVLYKFILIASQSEGKTKTSVLMFFIGTIIGIIGIFLNMLGGILYSLWIEIAGLIAFDIGLIIIVRGFLIE